MSKDQFNELKPELKNQFKALLNHPEEHAKEYNLSNEQVHSIQQLKDWQKDQMWKAFLEGAKNKFASSSDQKLDNFIVKTAESLIDDMEDIQVQVKNKSDFVTLMKHPENIKYDLEEETILELKSLNKEQQNELWKMIKSEEHLFDNKAEEFFVNLGSKLKGVIKNIVEELGPVLEKVFLKFFDLGGHMLDKTIEKAITNSNMPNEIKEIIEDVSHTTISTVTNVAHNNLPVHNNIPLENHDKVSSELTGHIIDHN